MKEKVRVRFAPSPTGFLHLGGARTALFNYLFARKNEGNFILRIEDTDFLRSEEKYVQQIMKDLSWLGLSWDEGPDVGGKFAPYRQSERFSIYHRFFQLLKEKELVYPCFCGAEELKKRREEALKKGLVPKYDRRCRYLSEKERKRRLQKEKASWRFKLEEKGEVFLKDLVKGKICFDLNSFSDFILIRSDGTPSFHFAMVVDDALMQITHVIRGEDHLTNTLYHLELFKALGFPPPQYAHLPMVLSSSQEKLSKREEETLSISRLREEGFLPEAIINFLALLGYTPPKELISLNELIETFSLSNVGKSPSIADLGKLRHLNFLYLRRKKGEEIYESAKEIMVRELGKEILQKKKELFSVFELFRENVSTLKDFIPYVKIFLQGEIDYNEEAKREMKKELMRKSIEIFYERIKNSCFEREEIEKILASSLKDLKGGISKKDFFKWLRLSLTSLSSGPPLVEVILLLGKERVERRLKKALEVSKVG